MKLLLGTFALCVVLSLSLKTDSHGTPRTSRTTSQAKANAASRFGDAEHLWAGSSLTLTGLTDTNASTKTFTVGASSQGLDPVSFGQIVTLFGDWIGPLTKNEIMCLAPSESERRLRAQNLRDRFSTDDIYLTSDMFTFLLSKTNSMKTAVEAVAGYSNTTANNPTTLDVVMAAKGESLSPVEELQWHTTMNLFSDDQYGGDECAHRAYQVFHDLALETAASEHSQTALTDAYFYEAMGFHMLTDLFSAGHLRNPASTLRQDVCGVLLGSYAVNVMRDEDSFNGIYMTNRRNDPPWWLYGDYFYWAPDNAANRVMMQTALQASVDEVHAAWERAGAGLAASSLTGHSNSSISQYKPLAGVGLDYAPNMAKSIMNLADYWTKNTCPLFLLLGSVLYRRWPWVRPRADSARITSNAPSRKRFGTETASLPTVESMPAYNGSQAGYVWGNCEWKIMVGQSRNGGPDCSRFKTPLESGLMYSPQAAGFLVKGSIASCAAFRSGTPADEDTSICDSVEKFNEETDSTCDTWNCHGLPNWTTWSCIALGCLGVVLLILWLFWYERRD